MLTRLRDSIRVALHVRRHLKKARAKPLGRVIVDVCDCHPVSVLRNGALVNMARDKNYEVTTYYLGFYEQLLIGGIRSIPRFALDYTVRRIAFKQCAFQTATNLGMIGFIRLVARSRFRRPRQALKFKDLYTDGVLRATRKPTLSFVSQFDKNLHHNLSDVICSRAEKLVESAGLVICGHRTYYFRGILYRVAALRSKGLYFGPRLNNVVAKRLTPENARMSFLRTNNELDFIRLPLPRAETPNAWLSSINLNAKIRSRDTKPLICFQVWTDDNFKGEYNLFDSHFDAACEIVKALSQRSIPFRFKFHPQLSKYGVEKFSKILLDLNLSLGNFGEDVSKVPTRELLPVSSVVVTGNGTVGYEAAESKIPLLCYCDPHYYLAGSWAFPSTKPEFFTRLTNLMSSDASCAIAGRFDKYFVIPGESKGDFSHLASTWDVGVDLGKYDLAPDWAKQIIEEGFG